MHGPQVETTVKRCQVMSNLSKVVLIGSGIFAVSVVIVVHTMQNADRKRLREGVWRDLERQKMKRDNQHDFQENHQTNMFLKKNDTKNNNT